MFLFFFVNRTGVLLWRKLLNLGEHNLHLKLLAEALEVSRSGRCFQDIFEKVIYQHLPCLPKESFKPFSLPGRNSGSAAQSGISRHFE